jgi:hypothetical protein
MISHEDTKAVLDVFSSWERSPDRCLDRRAEQLRDDLENFSCHTGAAGSIG